MASITQRDNGKWQVKIRRNGFKTQSKTFAVKAIAEKWARQVETQMDQSIFESTSQAEKLLMKDAFELYWDEVVQHQKSAQVTRYSIDKMKKILGHLRIIDMSVEIVREYKSHRLTQVKGDTVRKEMLFISRLVKHAIKEWQIYLPKGNQVANVSLPEKGASRERRIEGNEKFMLLKEAKEYGGYIADIIELAIETGMRRGEILKMQWKYFNSSKQTVYIPDTKNKSNRTVPLSSRAVDIISSQLKVSEFIFKIRGDSVGQAYRRVTDRAQIIGLRFHDLRHEATSLFFEQGLQLMEVAAITGHKDLAMLNKYTHLRPENLAKKLG